MSLFRKKNSPYWWYDFSLPGYPRQRESTKEKTKAAAKVAESEAVASLSNGIIKPVRPTRSPTLREFSTRFLAWVNNTRELEDNSRKYYVYGWRLLGFSRLASMHIDEITREMVDCTTFMRPLYDRKTRKLDTETMVSCGDTYTNQALRTLKVMLGQAVEWKVIVARPKFAALDGVGRDVVMQEDAEILLHEQLQAKTKHGRHNRMRQQAWLCWMILQDTGMRPDELFPMRIEHLFFIENRIWIPGGKTKNARRFVSMSERVKAELLKWTHDREGWVFPSKRATSGHLESIAVGFRAARNRAGLGREIVPYSARHSYGTYQMQATGNVFAVSKSMGHANIQSMKDYQHPDTSTLNLAIDKRNHSRELRRFDLLTESRHTVRHTSEAIQ